MLKDLIIKNRSYRRFYQEELVELTTLRSLVDLARLSATGSNLQSLKYVTSNAKEKNAAIFDSLGWAGYLKGWNGPVEGERPAGYILILGDTEICPEFGCDHGIAAQSIMLGGAELGLGGCIIDSVNRFKLASVLQIPPRYKIMLVLALGKPKEKVVLELVQSDQDIKYWRDREGIHHVPKRALDDIILNY